MKKSNLRRFLILLLVIVTSLSLHASVSQTYADSISNGLNAAPPGCDQSCSLYASEHGGDNMSNIIFISALLVLGGAWLYITYKKKYIIVLSSLLLILVVGSYFAAPYLNTQADIPESCPVVNHNSNSNPDEFTTPGNEFESEGTSSSSTTDNSEFKDVSQSDEFAAAGDEFAAPTDEFASAGSEFGSEAEIIESTEADSPKSFLDYLKDPMLYDPIGIFIVLGLIGFGIKYHRFRQTRILFLLLSIVYLGFYRGACPCMISSFQNLILIGIGNTVSWQSLIWFLALIPATYLFGKVWCGWLCHLGALQDLIYRPNKFKWLLSLKAQKALKIIQISSLVILIVQLLITRTNLFCHIDPFLVAFNLFSANTTGYVLLAIMIISSALIYRPFCRAFCPVGLILGWVSLIPGARRLTKEDTCIDCSICAKHCDQQALIHEHKKTYLRTQECIMCGECFSTCKKQDALIVKRKK